MKDRWMNVAYEDKEMEPYKEPEQDFNDLKRIGQTQCNTMRSISKRNRLLGVLRLEIDNEPLCVL